ncbi:unnamed protein product [Gongylonema pulchrum]|uniref:PH domain-containing protein n=1 Tax=Gongylonema pulchrum TaxID=637853 RepID=A0A3P7PLB1_9BILA|nr:unnamed protein product [Gongylonema pulchrum]
MPDLQMIDARLDFSVNIVRATQQLCREIGIRYSEELSLKRFIPPTLLRRGLGFESDQAGPQNLPYVEESIGPGTLRKQKPISASASNLSRPLRRGTSPALSTSGQLFNASELGTLPRAGTVPRGVSPGPGAESVGPGTLRKQKPISASASNLSRPLRRGTSPALSTSGQLFNASELGTLPRAGTVPRGVSPGPGAYSGSIGRSPIMPSVSFCEGLENEQYDMALVHSPRVIPNKEMNVFRPQNFAEKAALNRGWLDSSRSLMEQGIFEGDLVLLRFKYMSFFDINPKYDPVRINQLYEQAKWSILLEEFDHTEEEAMLFAALQYDPVRINQLYEQAKWSILLEEFDHTEEEAMLFAALQLQATLQRDSPEPEVPEKDDVDVLLDELQLLIARPTLHKPKKLAFKGFKRAYFSFRDLHLRWHQNSNDINGPPLGHVSLKGCEVIPDISLAQSKFHVKLLIPSAEGMSEMILKCDTEHQYARWMAACRLASRGKTMADASYQSEIESIKKLLQMQSGGTQNNAAKKYPAVQLPPNFNVDEFISQRYARRARSKQSLQQRISEAHSNVRNLSSTEAKLQYIRAWEALPEHGTHYFIIQFEDEDIEFKPLSADCKVAHEFIGGYIFLSLRNKEQSQTLNEELFHKLTGGWA